MAEFMNQSYTIPPLSIFSFLFFCTKAKLSKTNLSVSGGGEKNEISMIVMSPIVRPFLAYSGAFSFCYTWVVLYKKIIFFHCLMYERAVTDNRVLFVIFQYIA